MIEELLAVRDEQLMQRFREGDEMAFETLVERHQDRLLNFTYRFTGDRHAAEDLYQEAFLRVVKNAERYDTARRFSSWLYRIATNLCIDYCRQKRRGDISMDRGVRAGDGELDLHGVIPDDGPSPAEQAARKETHEQVRHLLQSLPEEHRLVLIMRHYEGLKYEEISDVLGCPVGTVKSRIHYAFQCLKELVEREGGGSK